MRKPSLVNLKTFKNRPYIVASIYFIYSNSRFALGSRPAFLLSKSIYLYIYFPIILYNKIFNLSIRNFFGSPVLILLSVEALFSCDLGLFTRLRVFVSF